MLTCFCRKISRAASCRSLGSWYTSPKMVTRALAKPACQSHPSNAAYQARLPCKHMCLKHRAKPWAGKRTCPAGHLHDKAAAGVLHDVARVDGQRRQAEDGVPRLICRKIDERAKGVPCSPVVHVGHHRAQVRELRLLHLFAAPPHLPGARMRVANSRTAPRNDVSAPAGVEDKPNCALPAAEGAGRICVWHSSRRLRIARSNGITIACAVRPHQRSSFVLQPMGLCRCRGGCHSVAVPTGRPTNACCWRAQIAGGRPDLWLPSQGNYAAPMCPQ